MRFAKQATIVSGILSMLATGVSAQAVPTEGLGKIGALLQTIVGGIYTGISNAIWMKTILVIILFTVLYLVFNSDAIKLFQGKRSSNIVLSLAISLAAIAPIPNQFIIALFGALGFVGLLLYIAPVIGVMFLTRKICKDDERVEYVVSLIIWVVLFFVYIYGIGPSAASSLPGAGITRDILGLVGFIYIVYYAYKAIVGKADVTEKTAESIEKSKEEIAKIKRAYNALPATTVAQYKRIIKRALDVVDDVKTLNSGITSTADLLKEERALKRALGTLGGAMKSIEAHKELAKHLDSINPRHVEMLRSYASEFGQLSEPTNYWSRKTATEQKEIMDDINGLFKSDAVKNLLKSIDADLT